MSVYRCCASIGSPTSSDSHRCIGSRLSDANKGPINQAALRWLKEAKADAAAHHLYVLSLADWGLENKATGDWPETDRYALREQVDGLFAWAPENVRSF